MLTNVLFYLGGTPWVWFKTHEVGITSWDTFKQHIRDLFGNTSGRKLAAKKEQATRAQTSTELYVAYIQDVLALCHKADNHMSELDKVAHMLKGIADDAFNLLVYANVSTVDTIIKECRWYEQAKYHRITQQFTWLLNTAATSSCDARRHNNIWYVRIYFKVICSRHTGVKCSMASWLCCANKEKFLHHEN